MISAIHQVQIILLDRGSSMCNKITSNYEKECMNIFFQTAKKCNCNILYCLVTFNDSSNIICDFTSDLSKVSHSYYQYFDQRYGSSKCFDGIDFCVKQLAKQHIQYPDATFRIFVISDGIIEQSNSIYISRIANNLISNNIFMDVSIMNGWACPTLCSLAKWSGGCVFNIENDNVYQIFGNISLFDPRVRLFQHPENNKITSTMVWDQNEKIFSNFDIFAPTEYENSICNFAKKAKNNEELNSTKEELNELKNKIINNFNEINNQIKDAPNSSIILEIGGTGCGKTTFAQCMLGKNMEKVRCFNWEALNIVGNDLINQEEIGHDGNSKTKTIKMHYIHEIDTILVDCPGFYDSEGPDQSIVNSISINHVFNARHPNKMKVLIFLPIEIFEPNRFQCIKDELNLALYLIPDMNILKECAAIIISKGNEEDKEDDIIQLQKIVEEDDDYDDVDDLIKYLCDNKRVWSFPTPSDDFKPGPFNNFSDADNIRKFMTTNPVIDPPHSIPLDDYAFDRFGNLMANIGDFELLVRKLFMGIIDEFSKIL